MSSASSSTFSTLDLSQSSASGPSSLSTMASATSPSSSSSPFPPTVSSRVSTLLSHLSPFPLSACPFSSSSRSPSPSSSSSFPLHYSREVLHALHHGLPLLALESTIITHGMPFPSSLQTALLVERTAREGGVVPATIAVLDGKIHVGLEEEQLRRLALLGPSAVKCSRRDLPFLVARGLSGSTTVSGTMLIAHMAGIRLFATGGIGGVHRGVADTWDVSADLTELSRTPVAVVCAGVKSILDVGKTLEYLETLGVTVVTLEEEEGGQRGQGEEKEKDFPAFFTRKSGLKSPLRSSSHADVAAMIHAARALGLSSSQLIACPVPAAHEGDAAAVNAAIAAALKEMEEKGISGKEVTPFLLRRVAELSGGESLRANIQLIVNNVKQAARIAREMKELERRDQAKVCGGTSPSSSSPSSSSSLPPSSSSSLSHPVVIGGANLDLIGSPSPSSSFLLGTSNAGVVKRHWGGVGRNVAECLGRLGRLPLLFAAVGSDDEGRRMKREGALRGIDTRGMREISGAATSLYVAIMDEEGDLFATIADMAVADRLTMEMIEREEVERAPLVVVDGNVGEGVIDGVARLCRGANVPLFFEPTSIEKSGRAAGPWARGEVQFASPSAAELLAMAEKMGYKGGKRETKGKGKGGGEDRAYYQGNRGAEDQELINQCSFLLNQIDWGRGPAASSSPSLRFAHILLKRGEKGVLLVSRYPSSPSSASSSSPSSVPPSSILFHHFPARVIPPSLIVNTSGAGDTLVGCFVHRLLSLWEKEGKKGAPGSNYEHVKEAVVYGMRGAEMTLQHAESINPNITQEEMERRMRERG